MLSQFLRYVLVGGLATAIHYVVLYALHKKLGWNGVLSTTLGLLLSAAFNFIANYHFTFQSKTRLLNAVLRFVVVITLGLLINASIFWLLVTRLSWFYLWGQAIATAAVLVWNFLFSRSFIYASGSHTFTPTTMTHRRSPSPKLEEVTPPVDADDFERD